MRIKTSLTLIGMMLISCQVFSNDVSKAPLGPFSSLLSVMSFGTSVSFNNPFLEAQEIKFSTPDLGRYNQASVPILDNINHYNQVVFDAPMQQQNMLSPFNQQAGTGFMPTTNQQQSSENTSFDELQVGYAKSFDEAQSYPPEWAQPNPLRQQQFQARQFQGQPFQGQPNQQGNFQANPFQANNPPVTAMQNQNNNMLMGVPFPAQMMPWGSTNNQNNLRSR